MKNSISFLENHKAISKQREQLSEYKHWHLSAGFINIVVGVYVIEGSLVISGSIHLFLLNWDHLITFKLYFWNQMWKISDNVILVQLSLFPSWQDCVYFHFSLKCLLNKYYVFNFYFLNLAGCILLEPEMDINFLNCVPWSAFIA